MKTPETPKPAPDPFAEGNLTPAGALPMEQQLAALQSQVAALTSLLGGALQQAFKGPKFESAVEKQPLSGIPPRPVDEKRIRIVLEDNDQIPPSGQFIGVDGTPYMLQANVEVDVPSGLLDVLDNAVMSVPIADPATGQITGYRDRLRFPYRVVRQREQQSEPELAHAE